MTTEPTDDLLERVKEEIRAQAEAARSRAPLPRREVAVRGEAGAAGGAEAGIDRARTTYSIGELSAENHNAFIERAFRSVLKRPPDPAGQAAAAQLLAHGASKAEVIGNLRYSPEGRRVGTKVSGLLPRYALAKIERVPVIGLVVGWVLAFIALPFLMRHQRAMDTRETARYEESSAHLAAIGDSLARLEARVAADVEVLRADIAQLGDVARGFESRLAETESRFSDVPGLRQYVHAMNHWWLSVRRAIDDVESAAENMRARGDAISAAIETEEAARARHASRREAWCAALASRLAQGAAVLVAGAGDGDMAARLAERGFRVAGTETNRVLAARARERGLDVACAEPLTALARTESASLDAIAIECRDADDALIGDLLAEAARALKPGALLLLAGWRGVDAPAAIAAAVRSAGFDAIAAAAVADAVLARRA